MRRLMIAISSAILLAGALVGVASAAPTEKNPNVEPADVNCGDSTIGTVTVLTMGFGVAAFLPDGQVVVGLRDSGNVSFTLTTFDGAVSVGPFFDSFEAGAKGKGFEGRLVECSFTATFTDTFILDAGAAEFFGIPAGYVGTEVTVQGTVTDGKVSFIIPGK